MDELKKLIEFNVQRQAQTADLRWQAGECLRAIQFLTDDIV